MNAFFDTSVLVPVFFGDHIHHSASIARFTKFEPSTGCCGARSLVEVYSTLTRMPGSLRISRRLSVVALEGEEHLAALSASAALGIVGGSIYDAMLAHCAIKAGAKTIYTWNVRHCALCRSSLADRLSAP